MFPKMWAISIQIAIWTLAASQIENKRTITWLRNQPLPLPPKMCQIAKASPVHSPRSDRPTDVRLESGLWSGRSKASNVLLVSLSSGSLRGEILLRTKMICLEFWSKSWGSVSSDHFFTCRFITFILVLPQPNWTWGFSFRWKGFDLSNLPHKPYMWNTWVSTQVHARNSCFKVAVDFLAASTSFLLSFSGTWQCHYPIFFFSPPLDDFLTVFHGISMALEIPLEPSPTYLSAVKSLWCFGSSQTTVAFALRRI